MYRIALRTTVKTPLAARVAAAPAVRSFSGLINLSSLNNINNSNSKYITFNTNKSLYSKRNYSVIDIDVTPEIDFQKMSEIVEKKDPNVVIVDVREPDEFNAGHIPGAINIPCKSSPGALGLDETKFKEVFGFDKPSTDKTLVFYCLAGVRARMSEELAGTYGYKNRINYTPSFSNWVDQNGKIEIPENKE